MNETMNNVKLLEPPSTSRPPELSHAPHPKETPRGPGHGFSAWLVGAMPTALVLLALGGVAWWGHQTGWKVPSFSTLWGNGPPEKDDWCEAHSVPESICVECNAKLLRKPPAYGWCAKHGVHDCPLEHRDVAQLPKLPCVTQADLERAQRALDFAIRPANNRKCKLHPRRLQFASQQAMDRAGVELMPVWESEVEESVAANGEVNYDPNRVTPLAAPVPGRVWRVLAEIGQAVKQGDVLALVDAAEVGKAKAEFLQALAQVSAKSKTLNGMRRAYGRGAIAEAKFRETEAALRRAEIQLVAAQQALGNLGLPVRSEEVQNMSPARLGERLQFLGLEALADTLRAEQTATANLIPVKAPRAGVVVVRRANVGEMVDVSKTLFVVADPQRLWLTLQVRPETLQPFRQTDPKLLLQGKTVHFRPDGTREDVTARVAWVSTAVDPRTRTLEVRADLPNPGGRLRANTFGAGRIVLRVEKSAVVVPSEAVHWEGNCHVVFVYDRNSPRKDALKVFHVRSVQPGARCHGNTEIIAGVLPGEMVAVKGSGVLRAQLLRNNLGEG
jgi:cobalt-zinc-cadmium efflux system membrane fusion protein